MLLLLLLFWIHYWNHLCHFHGYEIFYKNFSGFILIIIIIIIGWSNTTYSAPEKISGLRGTWLAHQSVLDYWLFGMYRKNKNLLNQNQWFWWSKVGSILGEKWIWISILVVDGLVKIRLYIFIYRKILHSQY